MSERVSRRAVLAGGVASAATVLVPRHSAAATAGPKVVVLGSSMIAGAFGLFLGRALEKDGYVVERTSRSASGLARPDFYDWFPAAAALVAEHDPDAFVVMFGANDAQGLRMPAEHSARWIRWGDDGWREEYQRRVAAFADLLAGDSDRQLFWFGLPAMRPRELDARVRLINSIYTEEISRRASGFYFETRPYLVDADDHYVDFMEIDGKSQRVRTHDGVHMKGPGAAVLVQRFEPEITRHLRIVPTVRGTSVTRA